MTMPFKRYVLQASGIVIVGMLLTVYIPIIEGRLGLTVFMWSFSVYAGCLSGFLAGSVKFNRIWIELWMGPLLGSVLFAVVTLPSRNELFSSESMAIITIQAFFITVMVAVFVQRDIVTNMKTNNLSSVATEQP